MGAHICLGGSILCGTAFDGKPTGLNGNDHTLTKPSPIRKDARGNQKKSGGLPFVSVQMIGLMQVYRSVNVDWVHPIRVHEPIPM